jgi:hypothetical protein
MLSHFGSPTPRSAAPAASLTVASPADAQALSSMRRTIAMEDIMSITNTRPIPGTDEYWPQRQEAFALIRTLERAIKARN